MRKLVTSRSGGVSSKRFMALIVSGVIVVIAFVDLFSNYTVSDYVFEGLVWLASIGWGTVVAERFAKTPFSFNQNSTTNTNTDSSNTNNIDDQEKNNPCKD